MIGKIKRSFASCARNAAEKDRPAMHDPHSILVVPVLNNTTSLTAQDYFMSTVSAPFAERGYYVFPAHMVKSILEKEGLSDAGLVHSANPVRFGQLFGCDSVLLIDINKWESKYVLLSTTTTVSFHYRLASCRDGATLWEDTRELSYSPQASNSANPLAALIADAIMAALEKAEPNYMPLASQANTLAAATVGPRPAFRPLSVGLWQGRQAVSVQIGQNSYISQSVINDIDNHSQLIQINPVGMGPGGNLDANWMIVCVCNRLNDQRIGAAICGGAENADDVYARCGVRKNCGRCQETIENLLEENRRALSLAAE